MTPLQKTLENYYRGYLSLTKTGDEALPSTTDLPRICAHDRVDMQLPMISIVLVEPEADLKEVIPLQIIIRVCAGLRLEDGTSDPGGTAIDTALAWVKAIQIRLHDDEAFRTYLLTLDEDDRTGCEIITRDPGHTVTHGIIAADNAEAWDLVVEHWVNLEPD